MLLILPIMLTVRGGDGQDSPVFFEGARPTRPLSLFEVFGLYVEITGREGARGKLPPQDRPPLGGPKFFGDRAALYGEGCPVVSIQRISCTT